MRVTFQINTDNDVQITGKNIMWVFHINIRNNESSVFLKKQERSSHVLKSQVGNLARLLDRVNFEIQYRLGLEKRRTATVNHLERSKETYIYKYIDIKKG